MHKNACVNLFSIPTVTKDYLNWLIFVDGERGFDKSHQNILPHWTLLHWWNHVVKSDVKYWVREHGGKQDDISVYNAPIACIEIIIKVRDYTMYTTLSRYRW